MIFVRKSVKKDTKNIEQNLLRTINSGSSIKLFMFPEGTFIDVGENSVKEKNNNFAIKNN